MVKNISAPGRFWIVRKQGEGGTVVMKLETTAEDPSRIGYTIPESCTAIAVPDRSALVGETPDPSVLTDEEREILGIV